MKTNENQRSKVSQLKINDAFTMKEDSILDVDKLMKVEGGAVNDEDWCNVMECISSSSGKPCYTNS